MSNIYTLQPHTRCGAKTRSGEPCKNHPVTGKRRCRMHGGAKGSGAPKGNKNHLIHGFYTAEAIAERKAMRVLLQKIKYQTCQIGEL